jgi:hypothetical protein
VTVGAVAIALTALVAVGLLALGGVRRAGAALGAGAVLAAGAGLGALALWVGARADANATVRREPPPVVGMPLAEARRAFAEHPPARLRVRRVFWGERGVVLRMRGLDFDGRYTGESRLTLIVGGRDRPS